MTSTVTNTELIQIADHCSQSIEAVVRTYRGGGSARIRDRVKVSASVLGIEPPPERETDAETRELNFDDN